MRFKTPYAPTVEIGVSALRELATNDILKSRLPGESCLSRRLLKKTFETSVSTAPTRRIVGAFASHLLLPACILIKQIGTENRRKKKGPLTQAPMKRD